MPKFDIDSATSKETSDFFKELTLGMTSKQRYKAIAHLTGAIVAYDRYGAPGAREILQKFVDIADGLYDD